MTPARVINIGLCGFGTVGQGVWKHLENSRGALEQRLNATLAIQRVAVRDRRKKRSVKVPAAKITEDTLSIANDPDIQIVCELIGGTTLAREVTIAALKHGKIVISANKALISKYGAELFALARQHGGHLFFEASVAGGIPIIKALREGLVANRFPRIYGILNGTCNHILTQMSARGEAYADVLAEAKQLGYAEADESLDVDGWDTAHKASVLAWLAHGVWVPVEKMTVEGIARITPTDLQIAATLGFSIKLLAVISRDFARNEVSVRIHPTLLPIRSVIANVNGVLNAVAVTGDVVGTTLYIGRGAGQDATASAVLSDLADAVSLLLHGKGAHLSGEDSLPEKQSTIAPLERIRSRFYLRLTVKDQPGVLAKVASVMARRQVSIASVLQNPAAQAGAASLVLTTHESDERAMRRALADLSRLSSSLETPLLLRIGDFGD
jgi:homoserine dehydrogenase